MSNQDNGGRTYNLNNRMTAIIAAVAILAVPGPLHAQESLYFADIFKPSFSNGYFRTIDTDGTNQQTLATVGGGLRGVAVDYHGGKIYWTDVNNDVIRRANLSGTNPETIVATGLAFPMAIDIDPLSGKIYWGDQSLDTITRANLDGSNPTTIVSTNFSSGLAVDAANRKIYWSANITGTGNQAEILRANLDGSNIETVVTGAGKPADIALNIPGHKVYWTDYAFDVVRRANLDGTDVEDLYVVGQNLNPGGIVVDPQAGKVFWGQDVSSTPHIAKIMSMNLDGSDPQDVAGDYGIVSDLAMPTPILGDIDDDNDVDLDDYTIFADCMTGPDHPTTPGCEPADLQSDNDVDLADFRVLQIALTRY